MTDSYGSIIMWDCGKSCRAFYLTDNGPAHRRRPHEWLVLMCLMALPALGLKAEFIYFWIDSDDMRYTDMLDDEDVYMSCILTIGDGDEVSELTLARGKTTSIFSRKERNMTMWDLGRSEESIWKSSVIYRLDTGDVSISSITGSSAQEYKFVLELDFEDGTRYSATLLGSEIEKYFGKYSFDSGADFTLISAPEPSSLILLAYGLGLLLLSRRAPISHESQFGSHENKKDAA